jgi:hypothetical protein
MCDFDRTACNPTIVGESGTSCMAQNVKSDLLPLRHDCHHVIISRRGSGGSRYE